MCRNAPFKTPLFCIFDLPEEPDCSIDHDDFELTEHPDCSINYGERCERTFTDAVEAAQMAHHVKIAINERWDGFGTTFQYAFDTCVGERKRVQIWKLP